MKLIFVHGINHQERSSEWVRDTWLEALGRRLSPADMAAIRACEILAPFYGDVLLLETQGGTAAGPEPEPMAVGLAQDEEEAFLASALAEGALALGVTEGQVEAEIESPEIQALGFPHDRRLIALAQALERISPVKGKLLLRVLPQAFTYLRRPRARQRIDEIVRPSFGDGPAVVVGHSLGSVVTYSLLRQSRRDVPFYMTLGSPLAIKAVQAALGRPFSKPPGVGFWLNGADPNDFVTLGRVLTENTFGPGVDLNVSPIDNGEDDPHDIRMYLDDARVAEALAAAVQGRPPGAAPASPG